MSTRSSTQTDNQEPARRHRRWPLLTSLAPLLLAGLAAAAAPRQISAHISRGDLQILRR